MRNSVTPLPAPEKSPRPLSALDRNIQRHLQIEYLRIARAKALAKISKWAPLEKWPSNLR